MVNGAHNRKPMNVLAFFAHPDDETMLAGGTLALLAHTGAKAHYLCATRGEGGETGEPPLCQPDQLGEVREDELACAVQALHGISLDFLGYTDPRVGPDEALYAYASYPGEVAHHLLAIIREQDINAILTHGLNGEYGHPAHVLCDRAACQAVESLGAAAPLLYSVMAYFPDHPHPRLANQDQPAHLILDISPVLPAKTRAALCHRSQHALFVRRASQEAGRQLSVPEVIMSIESLHRVYPASPDTIQDELTVSLLPWQRQP